MAKVKQKARITLVGPLTLAVGRFRFVKDRPVVTDDQDLIKYCTGHLDFRVVPISAPEKSGVPATKVQPTKPEPQKAEPVKPAVKTPVPVKDDEEQDDQGQDDQGEFDGEEFEDTSSDMEDELDDLNSEDEQDDNSGNQDEGESPKRLTRKS